MDQSTKKFQLEIAKLKNKLRNYKSNVQRPVVPYPEVVSLFDEFSIGYLQFNRQFTITQINAEAIKILGGGRKQFIGKKLMDIHWEVFAEGYKPVTKKNLYQYLIKLSSQKSEKVLMIVNKLNHIHRWVRVKVKHNNLLKLNTGSEYEFCVVIHDISSQKKNEFELKDIKREYKLLCISAMLQGALIENIQIGIFFESPSHEILMVNRYFCQLFRIHELPSELVGANSPDFVKKISHLMAEPEKFISDIKEPVDENKSQTHLELFLRDGRVYERRCVPVTNENGLLGYLRQYREVTQCKKTEKYSLIQCELGFMLARATTLSEALDAIVKTVIKIEQVYGASIYLVNRITQTFDLMMAYGFPDEYLRNVGCYKNGSAEYKLIVEGKVQYGDSLKSKYSKLLKGKNLKIIGVFPVKSGNEVLGVLNVASENENALNYNTKITLEAIVAQIGDALLRILTQNKLLESKENFRLLFNTCSDFMFIIDKKGSIIKTNPVVEKQLGYTQKELEGMPAIDIHPPDRRKETALFIEEMLAGKREICLIPLYSKEGRLIPVESKMVRGEWDGKNVLYCISRDITERLEAQALLQKSEARWQFALESSGDGIWDWDIKTNNVYYSAQWKKMLGYSEEDELNTILNWKTLVHPDDLENVYKDMKTHIKGITLMYENEHRLLCNDGKYEWVLDRGKIISYDSEGNAERMIGTLTDISARKSYEISLLNSLRKEKELNELKSRFVSMTSHELRTPLATMLLTTDTLEAYWERMSAKDIFKKISQIKGNVEFLREIIEKVLNLSHLDSGKMKYQPSRTNINELISKIVAEHLAEPDLMHEINYIKLNKNVDLILDKQMIRQVLNNLIGNAIKYSQAGTCITLKSYDSENNKLKIEITDQGIGIPEEELKTIWEPFVRGSNVGNIHGTGLGLTLARQMVQMHGGDLTLKSELDIDTTFTMSLPVE